MALLLALAPLILKVGGFLIDIFISNKQAASDKKAAMQKWFDIKKDAAQKSVALKKSAEQQLEELEATRKP